MYIHYMSQVLILQIALALCAVAVEQKVEQCDAGRVCLADGGFYYGQVEVCSGVVGQSVH